VSGIIVDGVRMDHVRRCGKCGRKPNIRTGYDGYEGEGPFIIMCDHGTPLKDQPDDRLDFALSRSWYKSRAVANWRSLWAPRP
jgi:hypothetical protein